MSSLFLLHDLRVLISQRTTNHGMKSNNLARELVVTFDLKKIFSNKYFNISTYYVGSPIFGKLRHPNIL